MDPESRRRGPEVLVPYLKRPSTASQLPLFAQGRFRYSTKTSGPQSVLSEIETRSEELAPAGSPGPNRWLGVARPAGYEKSAISSAARQGDARDRKRLAVRFQLGQLAEQILAQILVLQQGAPGGSARGTLGHLLGD